MIILKNVHSYLAFIALFILIIAVINALAGWLHKKSYTMNKDLRIGLFALIFSHIQLLLGLGLWFVSDSGFKALQTLGMSGLNAAARLLAVEHPFTNILAIAIITVGWSRHKKTDDSTLKFKRIALFYGLGLLLILSRIPYGQWLA